MLFLILQLSCAMVNTATHASLAKQKRESLAIRSLAERVRETRMQVADANVRGALAECYEMLRATSIESFPEAEEIERKLDIAVEALCVQAEANSGEQIANSVAQVQALLRQRNRIIQQARLS